MRANKLPALSDAMLDLLWRQWHELGAPAARQKTASAHSIIDPEALVLCSLAMLESEPRLGDALASWCTTNSQFLSVQRLNNLSGDYPEDVRDRVSDIAQIMVEDGKDLRWRPLARKRSAMPRILTPRNHKQSIRAPLDRPSAFLLRLRAIFGLGLRADIMVFLLRKRDPHDYVDAGEIARALGYTRTAVKRTLDVLSSADAVSVSEGPDPGYAIGWTYFYDRLSKEIDRLPHWKYAHQTFLWVLALLKTEDDLGSGSEFLRELQTSRLLREHTRFLVSEAGLFDYSDLRDPASVDVFVAGTTQWLKDC
ncbi:MAG: hypothetical protein ACR2L6_00270 [Gemmatimonadaceae bacterium]